MRDYFCDRSFVYNNLECMLSYCFFCVTGLVISMVWVWSLPTSSGAASRSGWDTRCRRNNGSRSSVTWVRTATASSPTTSSYRCLMSRTYPHNSGRAAQIDDESYTLFLVKIWLVKLHVYWVSSMTVTA